MPTEEKSKREQILERGISLTTGDRNKTYGSAEDNMRLQYELWKAYKKVAGNKHGDAHDAAMQHIFAKIARIAGGSNYHEDNYVDGATYFAIAGECRANKAANIPAPEAVPHTLVEDGKRLLRSPLELCQPAYQQG